MSVAVCDGVFEIGPHLWNLSRYLHGGAVVGAAAERPCMHWDPGVSLKHTVNFCREPLAAGVDPGSHAARRPQGRIRCR